MANANQGKNQAQKADKNASSEGFGFKQSPLGFDKNEVNLYINKLKKQMKEQQQEYETRIDNLRKNLEDAHDESNAAKAAARAAQQTAAPAETDSVAIQRDREAAAAQQKAIDDIKKETEAKILDLRKQILDERRKVAKFDKDCAMAQMSEKKLRDEFEKLKERFAAVKKSGGGAKAVVNSNADEVLEEACKMAESVVAAAKDYARKASAEIIGYKKKVEDELIARSKKLEQAKEELKKQIDRAQAENAAEKQRLKEISERIAAVTERLGSFAGNFDAVNKQIELVTDQIHSVTGTFTSFSSSFDSVTEQLNTFTGSFDAVNKQIETVTGQISAVTGTFDAVTKSMSEVTDTFGNVTKSINTAAEKINGVSQQFSGVSEQLSGAKNEFEGVAKQLSGAKNDFEGVAKQLTGAKNDFGSVTDVLGGVQNGFAEITKAVGETKSGIGSVQESARQAQDLSDPEKVSAGSDTAALGTIESILNDASSMIIEIGLTLPGFDDSAFDRKKFDELKKKLKVETTYVGGTDTEEEEEDGDIISSLEIESEPEPIAEEPAFDEEPSAAAEPSAEPEIDPGLDEPTAQNSEEELDPMFLMSGEEDDDMSSGIPLINMEGVGFDDDFTLDATPDLGEDFDLAPNDPTVKPDKGSDLGDDIFDMAFNPVDAADDTLNQMMAEAEAAEAANDFELRPAEIDSDKVQKPQAGAMTDDFGEFADLFAAGSAETTAPAAEKSRPPFRRSASDDDWSALTAGDSNDNDLSSGGDLSDISDLLI